MVIVAKNVTEICDDIFALNPLVIVMLSLALTDITKQEVRCKVHETYRTQTRQEYLYCQGRSVAECIRVGIGRSFAERYCNPNVGEKTWTLTSYHRTGKAVDLVPYINGILTWSHDEYEQKIIVASMSKYGFECGTNWEKNRDSCHYQVKGTFDKVFKQEYNTEYVTRAIQKALNTVPGIDIDVDGDWGIVTTKAVNKFRKFMGYKNTTSGQLGPDALHDLLSRLA